MTAALASPDQPPRLKVVSTSPVAPHQRKSHGDQGVCLLQRGTVRRSAKIASQKPPETSLCGVQGHLGEGVFAGLNNEKMQLLGLVMLAKNTGCDISLDTLSWRADWKTHDLVDHGHIWNVTHWNQEDKLPKLLRGTAARKLWTSGQLWVEYGRYAEQLKANPGRPRDDIETLAILRLKPQSWILSIAEQFSPPRPYGALHARVENDIKQMADMAAAAVSLEEIYRFMRSGGVSRPPTAWPPEVLFIAVSDDVNNVTKTLLDEGVTPWPSTRMARFGVHSVPSHHAQYLVASIVSFEICRKAEWFVGTGFSTFSNLVTTDRVMHNRRANLFYNHAGVFPRTDDGRLNWEIVK